MSFANLLWRIEVRALLALAICGGIVALYMGVSSTLFGAASGAQALTSVAPLMFMGTFMSGFLPTALWGAPAYAYLLHRSKATWPLVLFVGAVPGLLMAPFSVDIAKLIILCGLITASITHMFVLARPLTMRWSGP
jgi:hypothetical protein